MTLCQPIFLTYRLVDLGEIYASKIMPSVKETGILLGIFLLLITIIIIFWDWVWGKWWIWRFMQRLKQKGPDSKQSSGLIPKSLYIVQISETDVSCTNPNGKIEKVDWDDLISVEIITTDDGPFLPDVFWFLNGSKTGCVIPGGATGEMDLLHRLQELPGFRNEAVIKAGPSAGNARFLCWQKETNPSLSEE